MGEVSQLNKVADYVNLLANQKGVYLGKQAGQYIGWFSLFDGVLLLTKITLKNKMWM